jgi:hypothetical protein
MSYAYFQHGNQIAGTACPSQNGWSSSEIVSFVAGTLTGIVISFYLAKRSEAQSNLILKCLKYLVWWNRVRRRSRKFNDLGAHKCQMPKLTPIGFDPRFVPGNIDSIQQFARALTLVDYEAGPVDYEAGPVDYEAGPVDYEAGPLIELEYMESLPRAFVNARDMPNTGLPRTQATAYRPDRHWVSVSSYGGEDYDDLLIKNE